MGLKKDRKLKSHRFSRQSLKNGAWPGDRVGLRMPAHQESHRASRMLQGMTKRSVLSAHRAALT